MNGMSRRTFLQASGIAAGSLLLGCGGRSPGSAWAEVPSVHGFDAFLAITPDGRILVRANEAEMGQGTFTAFATLIGEELRTDPRLIEVEAAPVAAAYGMQSTGGSSSLVGMWEPMRETGARAREMLRAAAAMRWGVDVAAVDVADGRLRSQGRELGFGEVAEAASALPVPGEVHLTPRDEWRFIGKVQPRVDGHLKSTGRARYGIDVRLRGMHTAVVVHCPHVQGHLVSFDDSRVRAQPGVEDVFGLEAGVAIVADSYWSARSAASKLEVVWDAGESKGVDNEFIRAGLAAALDGRGLESARDEGRAEAVLAEANATLEAEYSLPYLAHATMEPMNCTVASRPGGCDVYLGTQAPDGVRDVVAHELSLAREDVVVHNQLLGGGFGRRFQTDMAREAAQIARRTREPVRLVWSREDDMARDFYRPASLHRLRASLGADGSPKAWEHRLATPSLLPNMSAAAWPAVPEAIRGVGVSFISGVARRLPGWLGPRIGFEGAGDVPYAIPNLSVAGVAWDPGIPVGIWRSVGHSHNGFVVESFIDELAHAAKEDPARFRRSLLGEHPRHLAVLDALVERSGWNAARAGRYQGIAVHESFGTVVGEVAEVGVKGDRIDVERVTCVVDCGLAVNPDVVAAQMESGIIFGLTAALFGEIDFVDGAAVESNFHDYRMIRMADAPAIDVVILESERPPSGVGEPGTPPIAPAVANAVFAATGRRLRSLPLRLG